MTAKECIDQLKSSNPFMRGCRDIYKCNDYVNSLLELLEKQIPKNIDIRNSIHHYCPSCDLYFDSRDWKSKYCGRCGQAIKWE